MDENTYFCIPNISMKKFQNIISIVIIFLVLIFIGIKFYQSNQKKKIVWVTEDREILVNNCIETIGARAIRFPLLTEEYCECTADTLMTHFSKFEYLEIETQTFEKKSKIFTPIILECHNRYQEQMFFQSKLD